VGAGRVALAVLAVVLGGVSSASRATVAAVSPPHVVLIVEENRS
jgi:hypothetical protein